MSSENFSLDHNLESSLITSKVDVYTANGDDITPALNEDNLATNTFQNLVLGEAVPEVHSLVEQTVLFAPHLAVENAEASWIEMMDITGDKFDVYTGEIDLQAQDWKIVDSYSKIITDINSVVSGENLDESFSTQLVDFLVIDGKDFIPEKAEITLTSFNNEQIVETGESIDITWEDNIDDNVAIALYQGDSFVEDIAESTESDGSYTWTVSDNIVSGSDYNLKISSVADDNIFDLSDANFDIYKPEITITSLDNGETFKPGEEVHLTWTDNLFENVKIDLYRDNSLVETIAESTTSDGETLWVVPDNLPYSDRYKVKISSVNNENIYDITPEFFSIFQPEIDVLSNLQDFTLEPGEDYSIIWNDNIDENVSIDLYREDNLVSSIAESTDSDGNYVWTVPDNIAIDDTYQIRVYGSADSTVGDFSDGYFTVKKPDITVVSLNGGNRLELGQNFEITWTNNIEENVAIDLYQNGSLKQNIVQNTSNDGSYIWNIPSDLEEGFDYQIKISSAIDSSVYDMSDRSFVIEAEDAINSLTDFSNLGSLSTGKVLDNSALNVSTSKLHRFEVDLPSLFELDFNGLSSTYKVELIQDINNNGIVDDNEVLAHTQQSGTYNDLSIPILPGTYFVRDDLPFYPVKTFDFDPTDSNNYGLSFGATPLDTPDRVDPNPVNSYFGEKVTRSFYNNVEDDGVSSYQSKYGHFLMYGDIVDYYANNYYNHPNTKEGLFRNYSGLGLPTSPIYIDANGDRVMEFEGGTLTNIGGTVKAKYNHKNGDRFELVGKGAPDGMELQWKNDYAWFNPNSVGQPKGEVRRIKDGWIQEFEGSNDGRSIFLVKDGQQVEGGFDRYTDKNGNEASFPKGAPYRVQGGTLNVYLHTGGYERENGLGFPISGEDGKHNQNTNYRNHQLFENGFIATTTNNQLLIKNNQGGFFNVVGYDQNAIHGTYVDTFNRNGGEAKLGSPMINVKRWGGGYVQDFSGGSDGRGAILKSDANDNSYWVGGKFWEVYRANGDIGKLGYPTSDVFNDGYGNLAQDFGEYRITVQSNGSAFVGGYIKGHKLEGDFFHAWRKYDLGTPISRHNYNGTQYWYFDKPGLGRVSAVSTQYGTFPLWGGIRQYYISNQVGGLGGVLGKPKSAEYSWEGKIRQDFEGGYILWDGRSIGHKPDGSLLYPTNNAPVVYTSDIKVKEDNLIRKQIDPNYGVESLISMNGKFNWSDRDGDSIQKVALYDYSNWGDIIGHAGSKLEKVNGYDVVTVDAHRLHEVYYTAYSNHVGNTGQIRVAVFDGQDWSSVKSFNISVTPNVANTAPVVNTYDISLKQDRLVRKQFPGENFIDHVIPMQGKFSVSDKEGDRIQRYRFYHKGSCPGGFVGDNYIPGDTSQINGYNVITIAANHLKDLYYSVCIYGNPSHINRSNTILISAFDGEYWSNPEPTNILITSNNTSGGSTNGGSNGEDSDGGSTNGGNSNNNTTSPNPYNPQTKEIERNASFNMEDYSIWGDILNLGQLENHSLNWSFEKEFKKEIPIIGDVSYGFGFDAEAFMSSGTFDANFSTLFDISYSDSAKAGTSTQIKFSPKSITEGSFKTELGASFLGAAEIFARAKNFELKLGGKFDVNDILNEALEKTLGLGVDLGIAASDDEVDYNRFETNDSAFQYIDFPKLLVIGSGRAAQAIAASTGVGAATIPKLEASLQKLLVLMDANGIKGKLGPNLTQKSFLEVKQFAIDIDGSENGFQEKIVDFGDTEEFNIFVGDKYKAGDTFTFKPTVRPVINIKTEFSIGGTVELSWDFKKMFKLPNWSDKLISTDFGYKNEIVATRPWMPNYDGFDYKDNRYTSLDPISVKIV